MPFSPCKNYRPAHAKWGGGRTDLFWCTYLEKHANGTQPAAID